MFRLAALVLPALVLAGCDGGSFVPPPPPELSSIPTTAGAVPPAKTIDMILVGAESPDRATWITAGRQEAGRVKAIFNVNRPMPGDPPAAQADLIRESVKRGASALIVEAADAPEVNEALNDVRAQGTPVLLIGRPVPSKDPSRPFPRVVRAPYDKVADGLVGAVMSDARSLGLKEPHALVTLNTGCGPEAKTEAELIEAALKKAGVAQVEIVPFNGDPEIGRNALNARIESDPKAQIIIGQEDQGVSALLKIYEDTKAKHVLSLGGLMTVDQLSNPAGMTNCAGIVDRNVPSFAREAVRRAQALAQGDPVPDEVVVPLPFHPRSAARTPTLKVEDRYPPPTLSAPEPGAEKRPQARE
jgi:ABC-type sugar transport system substrate-binding protein